MKLRIKGDSLRLRLGRSEVSRLMETGRVEETIHFGIEEDARLTYVLVIAEVEEIAVRHERTGVTVMLPAPVASAWAQGDDEGVYGSVALQSGRLEIAVEKDWACLDRSEEGNADTFPHPKQGVC